MLRVDNLTKDFGGLRAVDHCSFEVQAGQICGLIGPNGSGKTTVFNLITGFLPATAGQVRFKGALISGLAPFEIERRGLARTFQSVRVFRGLTVMENLLMAPKDQAGENVLWGVLGTPQVRRQEREHLQKARELLGVVGLAGLANEYCGSLSYAEQKVVEITRTLMTDPELILLDEPASGINPTLVNQILDYIRRLRSELHKTFLIVEHDMRVIMNLCDHIVVLNYGQKIGEGSPAEVSHNPEVIGAYLGG